jgi:ribosomal protein L12E/L44/L45/RPP1/RPP2
MLLAQVAAAQHREGAAQAQERDEKEDVDREEDKKQGSFCICV